LRGIELDDAQLVRLADRGDALFDELQAAEEGFLRSGRTFRNVDYPLAPRLLVVSAGLWHEAERLGRRMIEILERVIDRYLADEETRRFFMLRPQAEELASLDPGYGRRIRISRFDTFLTDGFRRWQILENNTDCPAGTLFTGFVTAVVRSVPTLQQFLAGLPSLREDPIAGPEAFVRTLLGAFAEFSQGDAPPGLTCLLQPDGRASPEVRELAKLLEARGLRAAVADPRQLAYRHGRLRLDGMPVDLVWNKINTVYFEQLDGGAIAGLVEACRDRTVCHVNSFAARYVTESKLCLAFLSDPRFRPGFGAEDRELLDAAIPWTRRLEDSVVSYGGETCDLRELALARQEELVIKAAYDIRGDGVTIGRAVPPAEWRQRIESCWGRPFVLQEYVKPPELRVPRRGDAPATKRFSLDLFMFDGQFQGFGSKMSEGEKLNLFQGGSKLPVLALADGLQ
jgi:hypothetical protein